MIGGGTITGANYGIKVEDQNIPGVTNYAIKTGAGQVSFGDKVGIGTTNPQSTLEVDGSINQIVFLKPSGGDDTTQIQDAINNLPSNGGIIYFTPGTYNVSSAITISNNGVKLRGYGTGWVNGNLLDNPTNVSPYFFTVPVNNTSGTPLTRLLWSGAAGGTVIKFVPGTANTQVQDEEISDLSIDGAGVKGDSSVGAGIGLYLDRVTNSIFRHIEVRNICDIGNTFDENHKLTTASSVGIMLTTTATATSINCHFNLFEYCAVNLASVGLYLTGPEGVFADTYHNTFIGLTISYWAERDTDAGILLEDCDGNMFHHTYIFQHNLVSALEYGQAVVVSNPAVAINNEFFHLTPVGGLLVMNVDTGNLPQAKTVLFGYAVGPGLQPAPAAQDASGNPVAPELVVAWTTEAGELHGFSKLTMAGGSAFNAMGAGTVSASSSSVSGSGTFFNSQVGIGDRITLGAETRTVTAVASDTSLTVDSAFSSAHTGATIQVLPGLLRLNDSSGNPQFVISDEGNVGIGTVTPAYPLDVAGAVNSVSGYKYNGAATSGHFLRGNGTYFVDAALTSGDVSTALGFTPGNVTATSGTGNHLTKWGSYPGIEDSSISDDGTTVTIGDSNTSVYNLNIRSGGAFTFNGSATTGYFLKGSGGSYSPAALASSDVTGALGWTPVNQAVGSGTGNHLTKWSSGTTIADSSISDDGTTVTVGDTNTSVYNLNIRSGGAFTFNGTATTGYFLKGSGGSYSPAALASSDVTGALGWTPVNQAVGSGTGNHLTKWSSGTTIADSSISDDGTTVTVGDTNTSVYNLNIRSGGVLTANGSAVFVTSTSA